MELLIPRTIRENSLARVETQMTGGRRISSQCDIMKLSALEASSIVDWTKHYCDWLSINQS